MCQLIIHHHGHDEVVTPVRNSNPGIFAYRGEDGGLHTLRNAQITSVRVPDQEDET